MSKKNIIRSLGPGLLFAGAAVGVSHLVYSTKAGALYGFGLLWLVLMSNLFKYPFFEFGPRYAAATGESLLRGYQRIGNWVLGIFALITLGTMFTIQAAVTIVTASIAAYLFGGITSSIMTWVLLLLIISSVLLMVGRYSLLDSVMKIIIITLSLITLLTVILAFCKTSQPISFVQVFPKDSFGVLFVIAFIGWMPAPLDLSVWHSLWVLEKRKLSTERFDVKQSLFDFNVGYIGTTVLALFFVALGALVMYNSGEAFSPKGTVFARQLIELYTSTLGSGMGFIVGIAAFITMFSTTITCLDALPRSMAKAHCLLSQAGHSERNKTMGADTVMEQVKLADVPKKYYFGWMAVLIAGSLIILNLFLINMSSFLMLATILSFLTTPFFAIVNYILVIRYLPKNDQPSKFLKLLSLAGIVYLFAFCCVYLYSCIYL